MGAERGLRSLAFCIWQLGTDDMWARSVPGQGPVVWSCLVRILWTMEPLLVHGDGVVRDKPGCSQLGASGSTV